MDRSTAGGARFPEAQREANPLQSVGAPSAATMSAAAAATPAATKAMSGSSEAFPQESWPTARPLTTATASSGQLV